jgi:hypothetical protein
MSPRNAKMNSKMKRKMRNFRETHQRQPVREETRVNVE